MEDSYVLQLQEPKFREFYLSYSGYAQCGPLHCYGPASRPHYLIHFVVKGKGMYQVSGQKHYLTAGQGFLIEPGTQTFYQADKDDPWSYLWIGVGGTNAGKYIRDIGLNSEQLIFRSESGEELKKIVLDILKHTESTTSNLYYLQGRLYDFFSVLTKDVVIVPVFIEDFSDDDPCTQTSFAVIRHTIPDDLFSSSDPNQIQKPFILKRILKMINIDPV